tara:strand:+ start:35 stop:565 length:531 start_codon:yes stop_codon:yes gene_type:complete
MSCDIISGRLEPCKDSVGGLKAVYFVNYDSDIYTDATIVTGEITGFATPITLYKFDLKGSNNSFDESNENSRDNGTSFWTQTGTLVLKKQDLATQSQLKLLAYGRPLVVVEDYNGNFRMAGFENGAEVTVNTASGAAMGDLNGYNITFVGTEKEPASFIDSAIIGDTTNTVVVPGT